MAVEEMSNLFTDDIGEDVQKSIDELKGTPEPAEPIKAESEPEKAAEPDKPAKTDAERERDEKGRFAPTEAKTEAKDEPEKEVVPDNPAAQHDKTQPASVVKEQPVQASPPPGWSIKSKAEWDKLPQHIRDDIAKRETEIGKGFAEYQGLKPFTERARQSGQTLTQVLQAYTGIEDLIRRDIRGGLLHIAQNAGLTQHQAGQLFLTMAQQLGQQISAPTNQNGFGGSPADQNAGADPAALQQIFQPFMAPLMQEIQQLKSTFAQQTEAQQSQRLSSASMVIEQFRQDPKNRYYDNLEETIGNLLEGGVVKRTGDLAADLATAYDMACRLNPEISEQLINERIAKTAEEKAKAAKEAADKARQASKSVTGSPSPGAAPSPTKRAEGKSYDDDLYEDVRASVRSAGAMA